MDLLTRLAVDARAGDRGALEGFVEEAYDQVWRLCAALVGRADADDAAQETFIRAVKALPGYAGRSSARTWLLAIARHACSDEVRGRSRRGRRDATLRAGTPRVVPDPSGPVAVYDLIDRLGADQREAFVLTQVLGLTYREASEVCQCPVGTVRSRVARGRAEMVGLLNGTVSTPLVGGAPSA